jgi:predicted anti-sigma-YlaC factor YlaD
MTLHRRHELRLAALAALCCCLPACSIKKMAVNALGNALAEGGSVYASDEDPDLVREAVPFGLKTVEALLEESPRHEGLLFAACSGFTQYAYAFVQQDADFVEEQDLARATALRERSLKLYLRALGYGFRGLELDFPGLREQLRQDPAGALRRTRKEHVPLLYWTALSWGGAISLAKHDAELTADQSRAEALMRRALELDEGYEHGSIHDFFIVYEGGRASVGGSLPRARQHFERALALAKGRRAAPFVAFAETVSVAAQDRAEFQRLLEQALEVAPGAVKQLRLSNLVYQKRARWLLGRADELFIE